MIIRPGFVVAELEGVVVLWWRTDVSVEGAAATDQIMEQLERRSARHFGFITVVDAQADLRVPGPARTAVSRMIKRFEPSISAAAIVFEGDGFKATAVRSIVTAINLAARNKFPNRVFPLVAPAVRWVLESLEGPKTQPAILVDRIAALRSKMSLAS
jgi:hypothetical protein